MSIASLVACRFEQKTKTRMRSILIFLLLLSMSTHAQFELSKDSRIYWVGDYIGSDLLKSLSWDPNATKEHKGHEGTLQLLAGTVSTSSTGQIVKGDFVIDMTSIACTDLKDARGRKNLEDHLRSADFFDTQLFPKAGFSISQITPVEARANEFMITGFLSIKGVTNMIRFPATILLNKEVITAKGEVIIDRTKWNINYQSKTIFTTLKDGFISDHIKITMDLTFRTRQVN
jgi:polyisoprenoid-binding protein YceI